MEVITHIVLPFIEPSRAGELGVSFLEVHQL